MQKENSNQTTLVVTCPACAHEFALAETMRADVEAELTKHFKEKIAKVRAEYELDLKKARKSEQERQAEFDAKLQEQRAEDLAVLQKQAMNKANADAAIKVQAANAEAESYRAKLQVAQQAQLDLQREKRELEDAKRSFALEKQEAVLAAETKAREDAEKAVATERAQERKQHEIQLQRAQDHAAALQKKLEQKPSQELQGEAFEEIFGDRLGAAFIEDEIVPIKKGQAGADFKQVVNGKTSQGDGVLIFECKNAGVWNAAWIDKARDDASKELASSVVIVTAAMPKGFVGFGYQNGVWVCEPKFALQLAAVLRKNVLEVASSRTAIAGRATKAEALWDYLTGPEFRAKVEDGMRAYAELRTLLDKEKKGAQLRWNKQEKALDKMVESVWGIAGSIQGLGGDDVPAFDEPDVLALEAGDGEDAA